MNTHKMQRYLCTNDECPHYISRLRRGVKGRKARYILCDAILGDEGAIKISCTACRQMYLIGMTAKKEEPVDQSKPSGLELLRGLDMEKFAKQT